MLIRKGTRLTDTIDTVPLSSLSKVSQVVLGGITQGSASIASAQRLNLLGGALTNIGANQACGMLFTICLEELTR